QFGGQTVLVESDCAIEREAKRLSIECHGSQARRDIVTGTLLGLLDAVIVKTHSAASAKVRLSCRVNRIAWPGRTLGGQVSRSIWGELNPCEPKRRLCWLPVEPSRVASFD